jgi:UMF1 family MFS transporter
MNIEPAVTAVEDPLAAEQASLNPGVTRREVWSWAMYDFANSGYTTVILTTVFNAYFVSVVCGGASWGTLAWTGALSCSYLCIMLSMPALGARADAHAGKRKLLYTSTIGCILATLLLSRVGAGDIWLGLVAIAVSNYFYCIGESVIAAFLPQLAQPKAMGRVSGWGWSFGYCGGMLSLGLSLVYVTLARQHGLEAPQFVPWVVVITAVFFGLAALPSFLLLTERAVPRDVAWKPPPMLRQLARAWRETERRHPQFRRLLVCIACYQAGISVVITLAAVYAQEAMGFGMAQTMLLVFLVNIAAAVGAFGFGYMQDRLGHKRALALTLCGWIAMVLIAYEAVTIPVFWVAATLAGICMGTSQSAGRAMVGALAPASRPAEFFALWTFAVQLAAVIGPLTYGVVTWVTAGNHRLAILVTGMFFVGGLLLLGRLDMAQGLAERDAAGV